MRPGGKRQVESAPPHDDVAGVVHADRKTRPNFRLNSQPTIPGVKLQSTRSRPNETHDTLQIERTLSRTAKFRLTNASADSHIRLSRPMIRVSTQRGFDTVLLIRDCDCPLLSSN